MKRLGYLAMLMVLSSSASTAQAGDSYSFVIGGHRIHIEARHGCRSLSCVSWSDLGRSRRDRDNDATPAKPTVAAPAPVEPAPGAVQAPPAPAPVQQTQPVQQAQLQPPPAPQAPARQVQVPQVQVAPPAAPAPAPVVTAPPATKVATETVAPPPAAPKTIELASTTTQSVPPPAPKTEAKIVVLPAPAVTQPPAPKTEVKTEAKIVVPEKPPAAAQPAPAPANSKVEQEVADTPLGDWQTEGKKGLVRIEQCGKSLCGYALNASTNAKGEIVLSNMKSKIDNKWTGDIFSRASGNSYYAKMTLTAPNTLRVEACAVLRFFCSGNDWTRVVTKPDEMIISRQGASEPSS